MTSQHGNVLFLILIAVALFAALSYAVTSTSRTGENNTSRESAEIQAAALVQYFTRISFGIQRLKISNSCSDTDISFLSPPYLITSSYYNANSPADFRCHLFHPNGADIEYQLPVKTLVEQDGMGIHKNTYYFADGYNVPSIGGTTTRDVLVILHFIPQNICDAINRQFSVLTALNFNLNSSVPADGNFIGGGSLPATFPSTACISGDAHGGGQIKNHLYFVLMTR